MKVYVSGISGTAMGALALFIKKTGGEVFGSDKSLGAISGELREAEIDFEIGNQDGTYLRKKFEYNGIDWFVYTSALPEDHPEIFIAKQFGIKVSKRDELIEHLRRTLGLKMVAVAGTHGKTTTTAMIIWAGLKLGLPISWLEGTTLGFAPAGEYTEDAKFLIYEADEYDRNFLRYQPWLSVITVVDYDHPDIYPTKKDYDEAFEQFERQSENVITEGVKYPFTLAGEVRREDAGLAFMAIKKMCEEVQKEVTDEEIVEILNYFPGAGRRFEKIAQNVYSDYAHHPEEIKATINVAKDEAQKISAKGIVVLYEPHQNTRQHEVFSQYKDAFLGVDKILWLPTFLTRENPELKILNPEDFIGSLDNKEIGEAVQFDEDLAQKIREYQEQNYLIVLFSAGPADNWLRKLFRNNI